MQSIVNKQMIQIKKLQLIMVISIDHMGINTKKVNVRPDYHSRPPIYY